MSSENPYSAPAAPAAPPVQQGYAQQSHAQYLPAGHGQRFLNSLVDGIVAVIIGIVVMVLVMMFTGVGLEEEGQNPKGDLLANVVFISVMIAYYTLLEGICGRTLGKLITGTKVVTATGERPSFGTAFLRSLCRHIPFEAFSFLGSEARGWHDSITKTWVVRTR